MRMRDAEIGLAIDEAYDALSHLARLLHRHDYAHVHALDALDALLDAEAELSRGEENANG